MFQDRELLVATKHKKERVIQPLFEQTFGIKCHVPPDFNTDRFGTFTGEIDRSLSPLETARAKAEAALLEYGGDLVISSEGSFGAHPFIPFAPADEEFVYLLDKRNGIEFNARILTTETNFASCNVRSESDGIQFLQRIGFPEHGVIIKPSATADSWVKDFQEEQPVISLIRELLLHQDVVSMETDMRAMNNPTRMKAIEAAVHELLKKMKSNCPQCATPGFTITQFNTGLPCRACGAPTKSTLSHILTCQVCKYYTEIMYPNNRQTEDPMYCDCCNP